MNINGFLIDTHGGALVYATWYNLTAKEFEPLPARLLLDSLFEVSIISAVQEEGSISGLLVLQDIPVLVSGEPILTITFEGPSTVTLVMVRALDSVHTASLSQRMGVNVSFTPVIDLPVPTSPSTSFIRNNHIPAGTVSLRGFSNLPVAITPLNPDIIQGSYHLPDLRGDRSLVLTATTPRILSESGNSSIQTFLLLISILILIPGLLTLLIVDRLVLTRLCRITRQVSMIRDTAEGSQMDDIPGDDELSQLASAINGMLGAITRTTHRVQISEKRYRDVVND